MHCEACYLYLIAVSIFAPHIFINRLPYQKSAFLARFLHGYKASALLSLTVTVSAPHHSASTSRHISSRFIMRIHIGVLKHELKHPIQRQKTLFLDIVNG
ncbi:hypothetical protein T4A_10609 [Trichinella pseudospiralis]|uniref:Uncharacterized protein n=1 Tax=Trichinella pseudospiralis TaxID=6337 RepID=A0A0V1EBU3_TRIPS|nr:hypothetical protein T4A_10609 [Trichinella pseudospiralis]